MRKWKRINASDGIRLRSEIESHEAALLQSMVTSMLAMLDERESSAPSDELAQMTGIRTGNTSAPTDVTLGRLLPDFHRPDQDGTSSIEAVTGLNSALRSLYEPEIIDAKREAGQRLLRTLPAEGGRFDLSEDDAQAWLAALNDVRLALGAMLGIDGDGPRELPSDDPMAGHMDIYHWLTVMQELLVLALVGEISGMSVFSGDITDVPGITVGHYERVDADVTLGSGWATGTTVVLAPPGTTGAVDVRGGAPGTRESDLLDPANTVSTVDAIVLTGGSAYGLAAADGVMRWLEEHGRGVALPGGTVPIVPGAVIFDLPVGAWKNRPDAEFGYRAAELAIEKPEWGAVGAGAGARAGNLKGGVGSASMDLGNGIVVGAAVVVNPVGLVINPATGLPWNPDVTPELSAPAAAEIAKLRGLPDKSVSLNTTIGVVATNAPLGKAQCRRVAIAAHDGLARAIRPAHTPMDGDTLYVLATGTGAGNADALTASVGIAAADCVERAVARAVVGAASVAGIPAYRDVLPGAFPLGRDS